MRTFATIPPYTDISLIKSQAKRAGKAQGEAHAKALDRAARDATGFGWSDLHPDRTACILDTGKLVMQWRGLTIELGLVDKILPLTREDVPTAFSILIEQRLSMDDDVYELGRGVLALIFRRENSPLGASLDVSRENAVRLASQEEPMRVRCGILAGAVWTALEELYARELDPETDVKTVRRDPNFYRQGAYELAHDMRLADDYLSSSAIETIAKTLTAAAPACGRAWSHMIGRAETKEARIEILRRAVAFGEAAYGPLPVDRFVSEGGEADWRCVKDYLMLCQWLERDLEERRVGPDAVSLRSDLHEEVRRVDAILASEREAVATRRSSVFARRDAEVRGKASEATSQEEGLSGDNRTRRRPH